MPDLQEVLLPLTEEFQDFTGFIPQAGTPVLIGILGKNPMARTIVSLTVEDIRQINKLESLDPARGKLLDAQKLLREHYE